MTCRKILITADNHVGHRAGLTPPEFQFGDRGQVRKQAQKWDWYCNVLKDEGPFDCHINLGDIVDGQGVKDSTETISDPNQQITGAVKCVEQINASVNYFVAGTRVHVVSKDGLELDLEVAKHINGLDDPKFYGQIWLSEGNFILDCRHAPASKSFVPHTRAKPLQRERLSNKEWALEGVQPLATHYFRAHCHFLFTVGEPNRWMGYAVPALQTPDSKYGRVLSNVVHVGMGVLTFHEGEWPKWKVLEAPRNEVRVFKL